MKKAEVKQAEETLLPTPDAEKVISKTEERAITEAAKEGRVIVRPKNLSGQVLDEIYDKVGPDKVAEALEEAMSAEKVVVIDKCPHHEPDYKTRLDAAKLYIQYFVGMPVQRSEVVTHNVDTISTLREKLQRSPALRRAIGGMLENKEVDPDLDEKKLNEALNEGDDVRVMTDEIPMREGEKDAEVWING